MDDSSQRRLRSVQLDEDINAKHIVRACAKEGVVAARRFPKSLKQQKDPEVIRALVPKGNPIVTLDEGFVADHLDDVPESHPGFLIVNLDDDAVQTIATHTAQKIIRKFKDEFPAWHETDWSNCVVRITPRFVWVWHVESGKLERDLFVDRSSADWQDEVAASFKTNASRETVTE